MNNDSKQTEAGPPFDAAPGYETFQMARGGAYGITIPGGRTLADSIRSAGDARDIADELNELREVAARADKAEAALRRIANSTMSHFVDYRHGMERMREIAQDALKAKSHNDEAELRAQRNNESKGK